MPFLSKLFGHTNNSHSDIPFDKIISTILVSDEFPIFSTSDDSASMIMTERVYHSSIPENAVIRLSAPLSTIDFIKFSNKQCDQYDKTDIDDKYRIVMSQPTVYLNKKTSMSILKSLITDPNFLFISCFTFPSKKYELTSLSPYYYDNSSSSFTSLPNDVVKCRRGSFSGRSFSEIAEESFSPKEVKSIHNFTPDTREVMNISQYIGNSRSLLNQSANRNVSALLENFCFIHKYFVCGICQIEDDFYMTITLNRLTFEGANSPLIGKTDKFHKAEQTDNLFNNAYNEKSFYDFSDHFTKLNLAFLAENICRAVSKIRSLCQFSQEYLEIFKLSVHLIEVSDRLGFSGQSRSGSSLRSSSRMSGNLMNDAEADDYWKPKKSISFNVFSKKGKKSCKVPSTSFTLAATSPSSSGTSLDSEYHLAGIRIGKSLDRFLTEFAIKFCVSDGQFMSPWLSFVGLSLREISLL